MKEENLLFEIKSLEKLIYRTFIYNTNCDMKKNNLTPTQMQIMEYILNSSDEVYQKDLEKILNLRRATVSGVLQTMEKRNLIERINVDLDARLKKIILHPNARLLFNEMSKKMAEVENIIVKGIPKDELEAFSSVLSKMMDNIKKETESVAKRKEDL